MEPGTYTITGAADWLMLVTIGGIAFAVFNVVIFSMVKGWVSAITQSIQSLSTTIQNISTEIRGIENRFQASILDTIKIIEEKGEKFHQVHSEIRRSDIFEMKEKTKDVEERIAKLEDKVSHEFSQCHQNCSSEIKDVWLGLEKCQEACCPRRQGINH